MSYMGPFPVTVSDGGTQRTNLNTHSVLVGNGTNATTLLSVGTNGQVLVGSSAADPVFATLTSSNSSIGFTTGAGSLSLHTTGTNSTLPAFLIICTAAPTNITGDSTLVSLGATASDTWVKAYDQGTNVTGGTSAAVTFTAPVTGKYFLHLAVTVSGSAAFSVIDPRIVTTTRTYRNVWSFTSSIAGGYTGHVTTIADMAATNTAIFQLLVTGTVTKLASYAAGSTSIPLTYITGYQVA